MKMELQDWPGKTNIPEKLRKIADDVATEGFAELTRLTVMKKWFERPERLSAFARWAALRAISRKGKTSGEAVTLFREARALLLPMDRWRPTLGVKARESALSLHTRLRAFQDDYHRLRWGSAREIRNWNLFLVEQAIGVLLQADANPSAGYKLAAHYCKHLDLHRGSGLSGPSEAKILEIMRFMFSIEAQIL